MLPPPIELFVAISDRISCLYTLDIPLYSRVSEKYLIPNGVILKYTGFCLQLGHMFKHGVCLFILESDNEIKGDVLCRIYHAMKLCKPLILKPRYHKSGHFTMGKTEQVNVAATL